MKRDVERLHSSGARLLRTLRGGWFLTVWLLLPGSARADGGEAPAAGMRTISGRVVDQYGKPVQSARVALRQPAHADILKLAKLPDPGMNPDFYIFPIGPKKPTCVLETDENGEFRGAAPANGGVRVVNISKFGYVWLRERDRCEVLPPAESVSPPIPLRLLTGEAVFHMRKKAVRTIMPRYGETPIRGLFDDSRYFHYYLILQLLPFFWSDRNKEPGYIRRARFPTAVWEKVLKCHEAASPFNDAALRSKLLTHGRDLGLEVHRDREARKWRLVVRLLRPSDGVLFVPQEPKALVAPETGYKQRIELSVPFNPRHLPEPLFPESRLRGHLFFRFFKPVLYGTCRFAMGSYSGGLFLELTQYSVNPYGGCNLEREPPRGLPWNVLKPLEKEFRAAILAADAGKPVKLPDEAKYKKMLKDRLATNDKVYQLREIYIRENTNAHW